MKRRILATTDNYQKLLEYISRRFDVAGPRWRGDSYPEFDPAKVNESEYADPLRAKYYECEVEGNSLRIVYITQEDFDSDEVQDLAREIERAVDYLYERYVEDEDEDLAYPRVNVEIECRNGADYGYYTFSFGG